MDAVLAKPLPGTENATYPFWSSDGAYLGFFAQGKLKKVATAGGPPVALCDSPAGRGGSWNADGTIIFSSGPTSPIYRIASTGGSPAAVITLPSSDKSAGARYPSFLPDGDHFFYMDSSSGTDTGIKIGSLSGGTPVALLKDPSNAVFATSNGRGYVLFRREETLMAQQFDPVALTLTGDVTPVASPVPLSENIGFGAFSAAADGTLVYSTAPTSSRELAWFDRQGTRVAAVTKPLEIESFPIALSPDEKRVAYSLKSGTLYELWVQDLSREVATRFTFTPGIARNPVWSPDGSMVYYAFFKAGAASGGIFRKPASGSGQEERLVESGVNGFITDLSRDGEFALFTQTGPTTDFDIWVLPLTGDRKPVPYLQTPFGEGAAVFAPVGGPARWVAYDANESGRSEVYLQQFPATGAKFQVSTSGGALPKWRADGRELYYIENGTAYAVPVTLGTSVEIGTPKALFRNPVATAYDVSGDGQRVVLNVPAGGTATIPPVTAVLNWANGLRR
jgi:eukaryotic-like serine/threonine-protein kinase